MTSQQKSDQIDAQWRAQAPQWGRNKHKNEREMLYGILEDDETIYCLTGGWWKHDVKNATAKDGIAVATDRRILFLYGGRFGKAILELAHTDIESVNRHAEGSLADKVIISVPLNGPDYKIEHIDKGEAKLLTDFLQARLAGTSLPEPLEDPSERQADIDGQWVAAGGDMKRNQGEREMLYDILEREERVESLIEGLFGPDLTNAGNFGQNKSLHSGVVVATNRRILFVDKGVLGSKEVAEMPYLSIETVSYSEGMSFAGVKITGRGTASYQIQNVHKGMVRPFVNRVREHMTVAPSMQQSPLLAQHETQEEAPNSQPTLAEQLPSADRITTSAYDDPNEKLISQLERLSNMLDQGILTPEEFSVLKKKLLGL